MGHGSVRTCSSPSIFFSMTFERFGCENKTKGKQKPNKRRAIDFEQYRYVTWIEYNERELKRI
jgi:hypothetical protein